MMEIEKEKEVFQMKKRILTFLMMGILTAGVLGGCGGDAEPVSEAEASRPAPEMTLEERPTGGLLVGRPGYAAFGNRTEYLYAIGQPLQSGETEAETVGELLDYWAGLPADDPLVSPRYSDAASRTRTIEHTYPVLGGVGEDAGKGGKFSHPLAGPFGRICHPAHLQLPGGHHLPGGERPAVYRPG